MDMIEGHAVKRVAGSCKDRRGSRPVTLCVGRPDRRQTTTSCVKQSYSVGYVQSDRSHEGVSLFENGMAHRFRSRFVPDGFSESTGPRPFGLQIFLKENRTGTKCVDSSEPTGETNRR